MRRKTTAELPEAVPGEPVRLQGWVHRRREHAAVTFLRLHPLEGSQLTVVRDRTGLAQVVVKDGPARLPP